MKLAAEGFTLQHHYQTVLQYVFFFYYKTRRDIFVTQLLVAALYPCL